MRVTLDGRTYELTADESVLDGLLRHGVALPNACRASVCQACVLRAVSGEPGPAASASLKSTLRARGYFLSCAAKPATDLSLAMPDELPAVQARLVSAEPIGRRVLRVRLRPWRPLSFRAGQYVTVLRADGLARVYSLACLPGEALRKGLELHVRRYAGGQMSEWLADAAPDTRVKLRGPAGDCYYLPGHPERPLLLAGTGTGIAPLYAVARDALRCGHIGPIRIVHGARARDGHYLDDSLRELAEANRNVAYRPCIEELVDVALEEFRQLPEYWSARVLLCGGPATVQRLRKAFFMAGLSLRNIEADAFLPAVNNPPGQHR